MKTGERKSDFKLTKDTPYIDLTGELWAVHCEELWENWLRFNGTALYWLQLCNYRSDESIVFWNHKKAPHMSTHAGVMVSHISYHTNAMIWTRFLHYSISHQLGELLQYRISHRYSLKPKPREISVANHFNLSWHFAQSTTIGQLKCISWTKKILRNLN